MQLYGAKVYSSPTSLTEYGKKLTPKNFTFIQLKLNAVQCFVNPLPRIELLLEFSDLKYD